MSLENKIADVESAASKAVDLVQSFAEQDPSDANSCWQNPSSMYEQLDQARAEALKAWKTLEDAQGNGNENDNKKPFMVREEDLRAQFMDMITAAFADVLNDMKESQDFDLDILVDCLQSGLEIMSQEDKEYFMADDAEEDVLPHEERRRELGFHVHTAA